MRYLFLCFLLFSLWACAEQKAPPLPFNKKMAAQAFEQQIPNALEDFIITFSDRLLRRAKRDGWLEALKKQISSAELAEDMEQEIKTYKDKISQGNSYLGRLHVLDSLFTLGWGIAPDYRSSTRHIYNAKQGRYYLNIPFGWAIYLLQADSSLYEHFEVKKCNAKSTQEHYRKNIFWFLDEFEDQPEKIAAAAARIIEHDKYFHAYHKQKPPIENVQFRQMTLKDGNAFYVRPLGKHRQIEKIRNMVEALCIRKDRLDVLLRQLHNPFSYYRPVHYGYGQWRLYIEDFSRDKDGNFTGINPLKDTCLLIDSLPNGVLFLGDVFERMEVEDLRKLELLYPDLTMDTTTVIAEYAERKKPTFVYFKRGATLDEPVSYYFLFYYFDYIPLYGWHLRDMEIVFPHRFLIWD